MGAKNRRRAWIVLLGCLVVGGCSGAGETGQTVREIEPGAFRQEVAETAPSPARNEQVSADDGSVGNRDAPGEARRSILDKASPTPIVIARDEGASAGGERRSQMVQPGTRVLVDAKVGDINGRAIYADEFLRPLAARLRAQKEVLTPGAWLNDLEQEVRRAIGDLVQEELLRAEALATLPSEQRSFGLNSFLTRMRQTLESRNYGSRERAERSIVEEFGEGMSLDEFLRRQQDRELVRLILQSRVKNRVHISWREIEQEYARSQEIFNPKPRAYFRWIRVPADDAATIASIQQRLDAGEPFEQVATIEANRFNPEEGGLLPAFTIETDLNDLEVFRFENLNRAAVSLKEGRWAGPIEVQIGSTPYANWIYLDRIEEVHVPLYDAQLAIAQTREQEETQKELERYISRLIERASFTDMDQMADRLIRIAIQRYYPEVMPLYEQRVRARAGG